MRCDAIQLFEGVDSLTVGQGEVDQHGIYSVVVFSFAIEPLYGLGAASDPFDSNGFAGGAKQCRLNGPGVRGVILDEKYRLRHLRVAGKVAGKERRQYVYSTMYPARGRYGSVRFMSYDPSPALSSL